MSKPVFVPGCCLLLFFSLALAGCDSSRPAPSQPADNEATGDDTSKTAGGTGTNVTLVNTVCPIMGGEAKSTVTTTWNGKTVGFCCPECIPEWDSLTAEEQSEKLTAGEKGAEEPQTADEQKAAT
jgi:hypothetical protein